jgi:hypothetical protein
MLQLLVHIGELVVAAIVACEVWLRGQLGALGVAPVLQTAIMVGLAVLLILGSVRLLGGLIRIAVVLVLLLIAIHIIVPLLPT